MFSVNLGFWSVSLDVLCGGSHSAEEPLMRIRCENGGGCEKEGGCEKGRRRHETMEACWKGKWGRVFRGYFVGASLG